MPEVEDIAVGVLTGLLNGVDRLISEPFWTHYETKVVASRLLRPKYWQEDPLGNLGEIFSEALGKPVSRKLRIKKDEYLYVNAPSGSGIKSITDSDTSIWPLLKEDYTTSDNGTVRNESKKFPIVGTNKQLLSKRMTIFKKKPEYADTAYGDSCIVADSLSETDISPTNMITSPVVLFSVISATGEFEKVAGIELQSLADGKKIIVLKYNGEI